MGDFRYKAFISYSWADAAWGNWAHHALETYRTPKALIGKETAIGPVPATLHPLFKDREEEAAGASIGAAVETALGLSEFLIVICSPRSAQSPWVSHEVAWFKTHRDPTNILALIVDGEPGSAEAECFPAALTHKVLPDLSITQERHDAPLAADARDSGDGKRNAKLKLAAAMLGIGLDELVRRDEKRRALRTRIVVAASLSLAVVMSGLTAFAIQARNEAEYQRAESDGLVEFMLTDLRKKLEPVGRLDALDVVGQRALAYYAKQKPGNLDADALGRRSRALHLVGEVRDLRGDSEAALVAFRSAAATTRELLARDPRNAQRIFDHAQSVYWVGYVAYQRGEAKEAEAAFRDYKKYADQLVALDPKKPEWQMERKYAESNLGTLLFEEGRYQEAETAFAKALQIAEKIATNSPGDATSQMDLANALSWLATTREILGQQNEALALLAREEAIYKKLAKSDSGNASVRSQLVNALTSRARVQLANGNLAEARQIFQLATFNSNSLLQLEPENSQWLGANLAIRTSNADALLFSHDNQKAHSEIEAARRALEILMRLDPKNAEWSLVRNSALTLVEARLATAEGRQAQALQLFGSIRNLSAKALGQTQSRQIAFMQRRAALYMGDLHQKMGNSREAARAWQAALGTNSSTKESETQLERAIRFAALRRLGHKEEARAIARELDRTGFRHPQFAQERGKVGQAF